MIQPTGMPISGGEAIPVELLRQVRAMDGPGWLMEHLHGPWIPLCKEIQRRGWLEFKKAIDWVAKNTQMDEEWRSRALLATVALHSKPIVEYLMPAELMQTLWATPLPTNESMTIKEALPMPFESFAVRDSQYGPGVFYVFARSKEHMVIILNDGRSMSCSMDTQIKDLDAKGTLEGKKQLGALIGMLMFITHGDDVRFDEHIPSNKGKKYRNRPDQTSVIRGEVGGKFISALRRYEAQQEADVATRPHGSPRPHIRAGHFHLYWTGKGRTIPKVQFLHPCLVNADSVGDVEIQRTVAP